MSKKKIIIYLLVIILLFQTTFNSIIDIEAIDYIDEIFIVLLLLFTIVSIIRRKNINKKSLIILCLTIVFFAIGILSCYINSEFILKRVMLSGFLMIKLFVIVFSLMNLQISDDTKKYFFSAIVFCSKVVMFFAIINFIFPELYTKYFSFANLEYRFGIPTVCSLFNHAGKYGWFMLFVGIYHYSQYMISKDKKELIRFIICAVFSMLSVRTKVIISLVAIIFLVNLFSKNNLKEKMKKMLIVLIILLAIIFSFKDVLLNTYKLYFTEEKGTSARNVLTENSIEIIKDYFPIGVGFGQYASWNARIYYSSYYYLYNMNNVYGLKPTDPKFATDTFWPAIFGETGVMGSIVYILIITYIAIVLIKKLKGQENKQELLFAILVLIQTLCESMGEPSFTSPPQNIFVGIAIGIALSRIKEKREYGEEEHTNNRADLVEWRSGESRD